MATYDYIIIGAGSAGAVVAKYAGRAGDGFICTSGKSPALYTDTLLPAVTDGLQASGRGADAIDRMIEMKVSFDTDARRALEDTRFWAPLALSSEEKMSVEDPIEMERLADSLSLERAASRCGAYRGLCEAGFSTSGVPCAGCRSGAIPEAL